MNLSLYPKVDLVVPLYIKAFAVVCQPSPNETKYRITAYCTWTARSIRFDTRDKRKVARLFREEGIQIRCADWLYSDNPHRLFTHSYVNDWHAFRG